MKLSQKAQSVKFGIYTHFKGKQYSVYAVAIHFETKEEVVIFRSFCGEDSGLCYACPLKIFLGKVKANGKTVPRFRLVTFRRKNVRHK